MPFISSQDAIDLAPLLMAADSPAAYDIARTLQSFAA